MAFDQATRISANGTTVVKSGLGRLMAVIINTKGATGNTLTLYDNTSAAGTILAVIDTTAQVGRIEYDVIVANGVTAVLATGTAADVTITTN